MFGRCGDDHAGGVTPCPVFGRCGGAHLFAAGVAPPVVAAATCACVCRCWHLPMSATVVVDFALRWCWLVPCVRWQDLNDSTLSHSLLSPADREPPLPDGVDDINPNDVLYVTDNSAARSMNTVRQPCAGLTHAIRSHRSARVSAGMTRAAGRSDCTCELACARLPRQLSSVALACVGCGTGLVVITERISFKIMVDATPVYSYVAVGRANVPSCLVTPPRCHWAPAPSRATHNTRRGRHRGCFLASNCGCCGCTRQCAVCGCQRIGLWRVWP